MKPKKQFIILFLMAASASAQDTQVPESASTMITVSPSTALISGTKQQQTYTGSAIVSNVKSGVYCDVGTRQVGLLGDASDSATKSGSTAATILVSDEVSADFLHGILGKESYKVPDAKSLTGWESATLTQNFLALNAHYFLNNSLGVALQQDYTIGYEHYLRSCKPQLASARHLFASVGASAGFANQRLYKTLSRVNSAISPVSFQVTYLWLNGQKPPKTILSAQVAYMPFLTDLHAYQIYETGALLFPTQWHHLTISLTQSDLYMNNAPAGFKRNYDSGAVQLTFSFFKPALPLQTNTNTTMGACYTADKSTHLYCYDAESQNACIAPSIFRPAAHCSIPAYAIQPTQNPAS